MKSKLLMAGLASTSFFALATALTPAANALTVRDDVTVAGSEEYADDPQWDGVVQIYHMFPGGSINFNCSGTLINARTVITAAHCFNDYPSDYYSDYNELITPIIAYGPDTFDALFGWLGQSELTETYEFDERSGLVFANQVIIHPDADPAFGANLDFPAADVALVSLSSPLANLPSYSMLFSPAPVGSHVSMVAYGGHGTGSTGDVGIDGKRQAGENILGMVGSQVDFLSAVFGTDASPYYTTQPGASQSQYWIDFDNPDRTGEECGRNDIGDWACSDGAFWWYFDNPVTNTWFNNSLSNDILPGDALDYEAGTAGGDSGSPLFFDELGDSPLIGGVLSGGYGFVSPVSSGYSDVSYYNPLFNFYDFIVEANPYKYVSAIEGDGLWSDPTHWVQDLDPGYYIIDEEGNLVNGIPDSPEPGVGGTGPNEGVVLDVDISGATEAEAGLGADVSGIDASANGLAGIVTSDNRPADGLVVSGDSLNDISFDNVTGGTALWTDDTSESELVTYLYGDIGSPTALAGPGSTGFVPNNGLTAGGFYNYFDVTLSAAGTTTLDIYAEVDSFSIDYVDATLNITEDGTLFSIIDTQVFGGTLHNDGLLVSRDVLNVLGTISGSGAIFADTVFNGGLLAPTEGMSIYGDLVLTSLSAFGYTGSSLFVDGDLSVDGTVLFGVPYAYGDEGTIIEYTGESTGAFGDTELAGVLYATYSDEAGLITYQIDAKSFFSILPEITDPSLSSLVYALDNARGTSYEELMSIYGTIDYLGEDTLADALGTILPTEQFSIGNTLFAGSEQLNLHLAQRFAAIQRGEADGSAFNQMGSIGVEVAGNNEMMAFAQAAEATAAASGSGSVSDSADGWGTFVQVSYFNGDETNPLTAETSDLDGLAVTAGIDRVLEGGLRVGAFLNYTDGETTFTSSVGGVEVDGISGGLYAAYANENGLNMNGYIGVGSKDITIMHTDGLTGSMMTGDTEAEEFLLGAELSRVYGTGNLLFMEPAIGVEYVGLDVDAYSETGGGAALTIGDQLLSTAQAYVGSDFHFYNPEDPSPLRPTLGAYWVHDLANSGEEVDAEFVGAAASGFTTYGPGTDNSWVELNAQLDYYSSDSLTFSGFVSQTIGRDELDLTAFGVNIRKTF